MNRKLLIATIAVVIIIVGAFALSNNTSSQVGNSVNIDANALKDMGNIVVNDSEDSKEKGLVSASSSDLNSILVTNNGKLTIKDSLINKTGDTATSGDDADFYGVNSAILVNTNATLDISNVEINTNSKGSNGIFVTNSEASTSSSSQGGSSEGSQPPEAAGGNSSQGGAGGQPPEATGNGGNNSQGGAGGQPPEMPSGEGGQAPGNSGGDPSGASDVSGNTEATIKNVKITTHSDKSRGLDATYKGKINAENVIINTDGQSCAALEINTGVSKTSGRGSPLIYSTGNITVDNTKGTSYVSQIACIEGKNSIEVTNSDLSGYSEGNRKDGDAYVDLGGIFIYQSMSGDADVGTSHFTAKDSKLTIPQESSVYKEAPMFHVTNTACVIDLKNTEFSFGSGTFLEVSSQNQWGTTGSNGGNAELNTDSEKIDGNVIVDNISSLNWTMKNTEFKGAVNSTGNTTINVADGSTWTLTGDSSLSSLAVSGKIDYGNYKLTVNGKTYDSSNPFKG